MNASSTPVIEMVAVTKQYGALRPLRIERLSVAPGEQVAILGFDQPAAEVFLNLATGATLPDTGVVTVFGRSTADIADSTEWLRTLDHIGIVSDRAAMLESLSVVQNLALPFSLEIEPPPDDVRKQAAALALEVGLTAHMLDAAVAALDDEAKLRVRVARALALGPKLVMLEHPSASIGRAQAPHVADDLQSVFDRRGIAAVTLTMDRTFASKVATRRLSLEAKSGRLKEERFGRIGFWS